MQRKYVWTALVTLGVAMLLANVIGLRGVPQVLETNLEKIPLTIGGMPGRVDTFSPEVLKALPADRHVYRHYRVSATQDLDLYIGYYGTAKGGRTGHNPYACLPGAGWAIVDRGVLQLRPSYYPDGVDVNFVVSSKGGTYNVMLHWYQSDGNKVLATGFQQNLQRFVGRVKKNRNDGAYVQLSALSDEQGVPFRRELLTDFAHQLLELLPGYWPVEG